MQIAVDNFRSFDETDFLYASDLNVFIGKNSSGKSSLLRLFPLLKQTFANSTSEPFLWYTPDYVDFGDYKNVLGSDELNPISFHFAFTLDPYFFYNSIGMYDLMSVHSSLDFSGSNYLSTARTMPSYDISLKIDVKKDHISNITIKINNVVIYIVFNKYRLVEFSVNDFDLFDSTINKDKNISFSPYKKNLLSLIRTSSKKIRPSSINEKASDSIENSNSIFQSRFNDIYIQPEIIRIWMDMFDFEYIDFHDIQSEVVNDFLNLDPNYLRLLFISLLEENESYYEGSLESYYENEIEQLIQLFTAYYSNDFLIAIDKYFEAYFSRVNYIAPLRAPVQRYYRLQGISLSEVDPSGLNIPMIIANMNDRELRNFETWTKDNFGFYVSKLEISGQVSILIGVGEEEPRNIIDLGFGYSQILPIIVSLWTSVNKSNTRVFNRTSKVVIPYTFVIEQPELHLHPAMQADFIDACIKIIQSNKTSNVKFIIETHSETIINRISESIKKEKLNHDSVTINIVNRNEENQSTVNSVDYDEDGDLLEWPIGFFTTESLEYDY